MASIKKKKRSYTAHHDQQMMDLALDMMRNKELSSYKAESLYGIPRRTLLDALHQKHQKAVGCPTRLTSEEEEAITKVIIAAGDYGSPLSLLDVRIVVHKYLEANGRQYLFNHKLPGTKWAYLFIKRNKSRLTYRATQNISKKRAEKNSEEITDYFKNLQGSLEGITKENILNYDETNLSDNPGTKKCLFRRGVKYPERVLNSTKGAISIMFAITAGGECLPPYTVYKAEHLYSQWTINGPSNARYNRSKSGWFDHTLFQDWFETVILPWAKNKSGTKVLIGDNLASHINYHIVTLCEANDIRFVFLPPNSSHLTQPLDVCYFGPLKKIWRSTLLQYKIKNPREATINKSHFPELLKNLMHELNHKSDNIYSAFKSTGIVPFNPYEVIKRLPDSTSTSEYGIDKALLDYLKESRAPNPLRKVRNKKLNIEPGKSVSSSDLPENVASTVKKSKSKKNSAKVAKDSIKIENALILNEQTDNFTTADLIVNDDADENESYLEETFDNSVRQNCFTPESLSKICINLINSHLVQPEQNALPISSHNFSLSEASTSTSNIYKTHNDYSQRSLKTGHNKIIILSDVLVKPPMQTSDNVRTLNKISNKNENMPFATTLKSKLPKCLQEKDTKVLKKVKTKNLGKGKKVNKKKILKYNSKVKQRKIRSHSETSSMSTDTEVVTVDTDNSDYETVEDCYIAECLQQEEEEEKENYELNDIPFGVHDIKYCTENQKQLIEGDWIIARFTTKKSLKHFVGKVLSKNDSNPTVKFARKVKQCKLSKGTTFTYPIIDDIYIIEHMEDVITVLPEPEITRRGHIVFNCDLSTYNIQ